MDTVPYTGRYGITAAPPYLFLCIFYSPKYLLYSYLFFFSSLIRCLCSCRQFVTSTLPRRSPAAAAATATATVITVEERRIPDLAVYTGRRLYSEKKRNPEYSYIALITSNKKRSCTHTYTATSADIQRNKKWRTIRS